MSYLFEHYEGTSSSVYPINGNTWIVQTFTSPITQTLDKVSLPIGRDWQSTGSETVYIVIEPVDDDGHPTGEELASESFASSSLSAYPNYSWYACAFSSPPTLVEGFKYAILVKVPSAAVNYGVRWNMEPAGIYSGGNVERSTDGGTSWSAESSDCFFRQYGTPGGSVLIAHTPTVGGRVAYLSTGTWRGSTFSVVNSCSLEGVNVYVKKEGSPGNLYIRVYAADGSGLPTGSPIATITISESDIGTDFDWYLYKFSSPVPVTGGNDYVITYESGAGGGSNWHIGYEDSYSPSKGVISYDEGSSWSVSSYQPNLVLWSTVAPPAPVNPDPADEATDVDFSDYTLSWEDGGEGGNTYDVYIGESEESLTQIASDLAETSLVVPEEDRLSKNVTTWYWRVDAKNESGTTTGNVWSFSPAWAPEIVNQPTDQTAAEGQLVTFTVVAEGTPPLSYQWYKGDTLLEGETGSSLQFYASESDEGPYKCGVSNSQGSVMSNSAELTINPNLYVYNLFGLSLDISRGL